MLDLVRKRHDGDGWMVFSEVGDRPGLMANRWADALALGVWKSNGFEAHLYEFKISREDLKRELRDPSKAEAVGSYCTYWWLVVSDEDVLRDLVIPDYWGILIPKTRGGSKILTVHRKAPKRKVTKPLDAGFVVSLVRNMGKLYKSNADFDRMREERDAALAARQIAPPPDVEQKDATIRDLERKLKRLEAAITDFATEADVDLDELKSGTWGGGQLGRTFKLAKVIDQRLANGQLGREISQLSSFANTLEGQAGELAAAAVQLRSLLGVTECEPACRTRGLPGWGKGKCSCGAQPMSAVETALANSAAADSHKRECITGHQNLTPGVPCPVCGFTWAAAARPST